MFISRKVASKVLEVVDCGLVSGLGIQEPGKFCVEAAVCYAMGLPHGDNPSCVSPAVRAIKIALNDLEWSSPESRAKGLRRLAVAQLGTAEEGFDDFEFVKKLAEHSIFVVVPRAFRSTAAMFLNNESTRKSLEDAAVRCETEKTIDAAYAVAENAAYAANAAYAVAENAAYAANAAYDVARNAANAAYAANAVNVARNAANAARNAANAANAAKYAAYAAGTFDQELSWYCEEVVKILISMNAPGCQFLDLTVDLTV